MKKNFLVFFKGAEFVIKINAYNSEDAKGRALLYVLPIFGRLDVDRILLQGNT